VRLEEPERALEVESCHASPSYAIRAARCRALRGDVASSVAEGVAALVGVVMVGGLTRRAIEATGGGVGATLAVEGVIEVARLARQVAKLPPDRAARAASREPWECWQLDRRAGWICRTRASVQRRGRPLFGTRPVTTPIHPDLYRPGRASVASSSAAGRAARASGRPRWCSHSDAR